MGIALGASKSRNNNKTDFLKELDQICNTLSQTRPTAVNLFWAINRMKAIVERHKDSDVSEIRDLLVEEALKIQKEDLELCKKIGEYGSELLSDNCTVLTHCNAGGLATAGYGTALGVIRAAYDSGKKIQVIAPETRPFLQGSRLTAWELKKDNIPVTLITDNMAGYVMSNDMINTVIVGADRVAINGDVANKIGTYPLSVLAKHHCIPFYVAAPISTIDPDCPSGEKIPIEKRNIEEVTHLGNKKIAADVEVLNPAFDITPCENIEAIITDSGIVKAPYKENLMKLLNQ